MNISKEKEENMKISKEDFEKVAEFITIMKKYDSGLNQWNVSVGSDVVQDQRDLSFKRFIYINGNMVELK